MIQAYNIQSLYRSLFSEIVTIFKDVLKYTDV